MRYRTDGSGAVTQLPLKVGQRIKLDADRCWWTVRAVTEHFAAVTRQAEFHSAGTNCYSVLDWRNGVRGPCDLIGQGYGDGSYSDEQCAEMLDRFESGDLEVSQRNWVRIEVANQGSTAFRPNAVCLLAGDGEHDCDDPTTEATCRYEQGGAR